MAQAPFSAAWNDKQHIQNDDFASSTFDMDADSGVGAGPIGIGGGGSNGIIGTQPRFFPGQWGQCSTTCGPGVATRTVECSPKPNAFQPCQVQPCTLNEAGNDIPVRERSLTSTRSFKWDYSDWTACSASCLGGIISFYLLFQI
ncbi:unnamed protein product [Onchocerca flexuosa]|uniref:TSP1_CCN domain-containing protein n=1 Tax=Onchocerca flexuosa TaxID=387005 RepID=A0A183I720_9BILA|nr:unnamed protein product [Onchocerca flexuosa]